MKTDNLKKELFNEVKKKGIIKEQYSMYSENPAFTEIISVLLHSRIQVHIFHWQTNSQSSFAEHSALGGYYESIGDLTDGIVESFQGKNGIVKDYASIKLDNYRDVEQLISYFEKINTIIDNNRTNIQESYIQNQIDGVQELLYSTLYKLKFLK